MRRRPDPVEVIKIAIPVLAEVVAVVLFLCMIAIYAALASGA